MFRNQLTSINKPNDFKLILNSCLHPYWIFAAMCGGSDRALPSPSLISLATPLFGFFLSLHLPLRRLHSNIISLFVSSTVGTVHPECINRTRTSLLVAWMPHRHSNAHSFFLHVHRDRKISFKWAIHIINRRHQESETTQCIIRLSDVHIKKFTDLILLLFKQVLQT